MITVSRKQGRFPDTVIFGAGDEYRFLATGADTDNEYFFLEAIVPPGGGPPPHIQTREEEAFYILEGEVKFYGEAGEILARPGTYLNIPKDAKHCFRNNSDGTAKMLIFFAPSGIEGLFEEFENLEESGGDLQAAIEGMNTLGQKYGVKYFTE